MAIDFTLTKEQQDIQAMARSFAQEVLAPLAPKIDAEPDPYVGWQMAKPAYEEACRKGIAWSMLPKAYGGGGLSNVEPLLGELDHAVRARTLRKFDRPLVVRSECRIEPGLIGAALLGLKAETAA